MLTNDTSNNVTRIDKLRRHTISNLFSPRKTPRTCNGMRHVPISMSLSARLPTRAFNGVCSHTNFRMLRRINVFPNIVGTKMISSRVSIRTSNESNPSKMTPDSTMMVELRIFSFPVLEIFTMTAVNTLIFRRKVLAPTQVHSEIAFSY